MEKRIYEKKVGETVAFNSIFVDKRKQAKGIVKELRSSFGRKEYLVGDIEIPDCWIRTFEK